MNNKNTLFNSYENRILVATPYSMKNTIFAKSIMYITSHSHDEAAGIMLNQLITYVNSKEYFKLSTTIISPEDERMPLYLGGPEDQNQGTMLHSNDFFSDSLQDKVNNLSISSDDIFFKTLSHDSDKPLKKRFIQGYTKWIANQLEKELDAGLWVIIDNCPTEIIFDQHSEESWKNILKIVGIDPLYYFSSDKIT